MTRTVRESTRSEATEGVTVVRTGADEIDPTATVRHYDQLSEPAQAAVAAAVDGERSVCRPPGLDVGDVVRYTGYFEVR